MIQGSIVAIITPMQEDGSVDAERFRQLIDFHVEQGSDGIVAVGTTGESATLSAAEHCEVIGMAVEYAAGRIPVIAGSGSNSTHEAIELSRCAQQAGAVACLLVTPYYNKPSQEGLYLHHKAIAEAVDIPQILYNVPGRTACDMQVATAARLAQIDNIVGIKDATGDLTRVIQQRRACGADFMLYSGDDSSSLEFLLLGGNGVISVTANVAPAAMHQLCQLARDGKQEEAAELNESLMALHKNLFVEANPIPVKWAMYAMGKAGETIRLPLTILAEEHQPVVRQAMQQAGVL